MHWLTLATVVMMASSWTRVRRLPPKRMCWLISARPAIAPGFRLMQRMMFDRDQGWSPASMGASRIQATAASPLVWNTNNISTGRERALRGAPHDEGVDRHRAGPHRPGHQRVQLDLGDVSGGVGQAAGEGQHGVDDGVDVSRGPAPTAGQGH